MNSLWSFVVFLLTVKLCTGILIGGTACKKRDLHRDYLQLSTLEWKRNFPTCNNTRQSPINIIKRETELLRRPFAVDIRSYSRKINSLTLENDGYAIDMKPSEKLTVTGGPLGNAVFALDQLHIHYGYRNRRMSEHQLNGKNFDLEIHFVHHNEKYRTFDDAALKQDGLFVLAVWAKVGRRDNEAYSCIMDNLKLVPNKGDKAEVTRHIPPLVNLLPERLGSFFYYNGSLTTPPCCESVTWIVMEDPVDISRRQLDEFRYIKSDDGRFTDQVPNIRPVQALNGRIVYSHK